MLNIETIPARAKEIVELLTLNALLRKEKPINYEKRDGWTSDYFIGSLGQELVQLLLEHGGMVKNVIPSVGLDHAKDLTVTFQDYSYSLVEVKTDLKSLQTPNFYLEYSGRGRDGVWRNSGVYSSKSSRYFIICFPDKIKKNLHLYVEKTEKLRGLIDHAIKTKSKNLVGGGDNSNTKGLKLDMKVFGTRLL